MYRQASLGGGPGDMLSYWHDVLPGRVELLSIFFIVLPVSPPGLSSASMAWEGSDCMLNLIVRGSRFQEGCVCSLQMAGPSDCAARRQVSMDMSRFQQMSRVTYMKRA